jgi:hypothetical protein
MPPPLDVAAPTRLTFVVAPGAAEKYPNLSRTAIDSLPLETWQTLADNIALEPGLSHYQAETLANRWTEGRMAIALADDQIVTTISLIPIFTPTVSARLLAALPLSPAEVSTVEMYESATGWTHPAWRQRGNSLQLRQALLAQFARPNRFFISATIGLGASYVLPRLGWRLVSWGAAPFTTALMGLPTPDLTTKFTVKSRQPAHLKPYLGPHTTPQENQTHLWADYCHFWLSDERLVMALDRQLAGLVDGDLARWRELVTTEIYGAPPEPTWKPFLFGERYG